MEWWTNELEEDGLQINNGQYFNIMKQMCLSQVKGVKVNCKAYKWHLEVEASKYRTLTNWNADIRRNIKVQDGTVDVVGAETLIHNGHFQNWLKKAAHKTQKLAEKRRERYKQYINKRWATHIKERLLFSRILLDIINIFYKNCNFTCFSYGCET